LTDNILVRIFSKA